MSVHIRSFVQPDQTSLAQAIDTVCAEGRWMSTPRFQPTPAWSHALKAPACTRHLLLVVEMGERIVGWCRLFPVGKCNGAGHKVELGIGLLPECRNRGIGKALVGQALDWAATVAIEQVTLGVRVSNPRAMHLFESCGFTATGHKDGDWVERVCQSLPSGK